MAKVQQHTTQLQTIFQFLERNVATGSEVSKATGVPHKNFTRYKRDLEKSGRLVEIKKDVCPVTGFKAWFVTCDKSKFPPQNQLRLW